MGAAIRYIGLEVKISSITYPPDDIPTPSGPPDYIIVPMTNLGDPSVRLNHTYAYEFRGELSQSTKLGSQISYASVDPEVFFNLILPPIVLNAGLSLKRKQFFRNIGAILAYAFVGTSISVIVVGSIIYGGIQFLRSFLAQTYLSDNFSLANCLYFGAIISPTDPLAVLAIFQELKVDVNLFALVFGESILNDAVSIVLTHSIDQFSIIYGRNPSYSIMLAVWKSTFNFIYMFVNSCIIGITFGVITAFTTKFTKLSDLPLLETSLIVLTSYTSFLAAEVSDMSGIVAILFCGITQAHYTFNNFSAEARERTITLFELLTFLCENFLFLAVGVAFWQRGQTWNLTFIGIAFVAVIVARALSIYPLSILLNLGRRKKIPLNFQHVIAWGGAARGVISYSLAARNTVGDARRIMLSTTSVIVIFSVIVVGGSVDFMLKALKIPFADKGINSHIREEIKDPESLDNQKNKKRDNNDLIDGCHEQNVNCIYESCSALSGNSASNNHHDSSRIMEVGMEELRPYENASLVRRWRDLDNNFIKPMLTHSHPTLMETLPSCLSCFAKLLTSDEQMQHIRVKTDSDATDNQIVLEESNSVFE